MAIYQNLVDWLDEVYYRFEFKVSEEKTSGSEKKTEKAKVLLRSLAKSLTLETNLVCTLKTHDIGAKPYYERSAAYRQGGSVEKLLQSILDHSDGVIKDIFDLAFSATTTFKTSQFQVNRLKNRIRSMLGLAPYHQNVSILDVKSTFAHRLLESSSKRAIGHQNPINWFSEQALAALMNGFKIRSYQLWPAQIDLPAQDTAHLLFMLFLNHLAEKLDPISPSIWIGFFRPVDESVVQSLRRAPLSHAALIVGDQSDWMSAVDVVILLSTRPNLNFDILDVFVAESLFNKFGERLREQIDKNQTAFSSIDYKAMNLDQVLDSAEEDSLHVFKFRTNQELIPTLNHFGKNRLHFTVFWLNQVALAMEMKSKITVCHEFWIDALPFFSPVVQIDKPFFMPKKKKEQKSAQTKMAVLSFEQRAQLLWNHLIKQEASEFLSVFKTAYKKAENFYTRTKTINGHLLISTFQKSSLAEICINRKTLNPSELIVFQFLLGNAFKLIYIPNEDDTFKSSLDKANLDQLFQHALLLGDEASWEEQEEETKDASPANYWDSVGPERMLKESEQLPIISTDVWIPISSQLQFHQ